MSFEAASDRVKKIIIQMGKEFSNSEQNKKRFKHMLLTAQMATKLVDMLELDVNMEQLQIACITHDYAKKFNNITSKKLIEKHCDRKILSYPKAIWHSFLGAELLKTEFQIDDEAILEAIRFHPTGKPNMTVLEKLLFVADYIELSRNYPACIETREVAYKDLDKAVFYKLRNTIVHLLSENLEIHPLTKEAYEFYNK